MKTRLLCGGTPWCLAGVHVWVRAFVRVGV